MKSTKDIVLDSLVEILGITRNEIDHHLSADLTSDKLIDSFTLVLMFQQIEDELGIAIDIFELEEGCFESLNTLIAAIDKLRSGKDS